MSPFYCVASSFAVVVVVVVDFRTLAKSRQKKNEKKNPDQNRIKSEEL